MLSSHWVCFSCKKYLGLLRSPVPSLISSKLSQESSIASYITSLLKLFKSIFYPEVSNPSPTNPVPGGTLYLYLQKYTSTAPRDIGFLLTPLFYLCKFPIQYRFLFIISVFHWYTNLDIGEAKGYLGCPRKGIGWHWYQDLHQVPTCLWGTWPLYHHWKLWCTCGRILVWLWWLWYWCWHNL